MLQGSGEYAGGMVNVAKPRLIVAKRQVKRRFTAGLMLQGSGEYAGGMVNVAKPRLIVARRQVKSAYSAG